MGRNKEMKESVVVSGKMMNHSKMETDSREKFLLILYLKFQKMIMSHVIYTTMINIFARGGMGMFPIDSKAPKEATLFGETG